jgi:hypothetical protein
MEQLPQKNHLTIDLLHKQMEMFDNRNWDIQPQANNVDLYKIHRLKDHCKTSRTDLYTVSEHHIHL